VLAVAVATGLGGGTLRDLLLDRNPIFWIADPVYLWVIAGAAALTILHARFRRPPERALLVVDALSLAWFSISGARIALHLGHGDTIAVVMGAITGTAGGVIRDVLCNEIPLLFRRGELYATAAIAGVCVYVGFTGVETLRPHALAAGLVTILALRAAAILLGLRLPVFTLPDDERDPRH
jgi:uncharacterized membrane protein YeiH